MVDEHRGNAERPHTDAEAGPRAGKIAVEAAPAAEREETPIRLARTVAQESAFAHELLLPGILDAVLDQTVLTLGAELAFVYLADEDQRTLELVGQRNLPDDFKESLSHLSFDAPSLAARTASTRQTQMISSIDEFDPALSITHELQLGTACETVVALPLLVRDRLLGVLTFALKAPHAFTVAECAALDSCADIFSFGIANAIVYGQERRLHVLFEAVGNATVAIASEFELWPVLQNIVDTARRVASAEYAALGVVVAEDATFGPLVFSGMTKEQEAAIGRYPRPIGTLGLAGLEGRTIRIADVRQHPAFRGLPDEHPTIISFLAVPVHHKGRSVGTLYFANKIGAREFSIEDERAVEIFAAHAGAAVHQGQLRDQLDVERARINTILESAPHGVHFVEAGTEKIIANRRAFEIVGQASVPTLGDYRGQVCTPDGRPLPKDEWPARRVLRGETFTTQEMLLRTPDGREVPLLLSVAPVRRRDGRVEGVVVGYEDISILKELQRLREEWASIVTHDLRQPLNVITLYVSMLRRMVQNPDPRMLSKAIDQTLNAVNTLNRMISDLADVSQIETKRLEVARRPIELDVLGREGVERQRVMSPARVINLQVGSSIPKVNADPIRIEQVLGNLLVNALKYSDPETAVEVQVHPVDDEVRVLITNGGAGISSEELPKLFDRFYRSASARAGSARGLGLGLYIAKGLMEAHRGRIWAESRPGQTTFQFALPVMRKEDHPEEKHHPAEFHSSL
jgi:PAS domain S-box-containing protein